VKPLQTPVPFVCVVAALVVAMLSSTSRQVRATTQPGVLSVAKLVITDQEVIFRNDKFMTKTGIPHYPRGSDVRYDVRNRATRRFSLDILGSSTGMLAPGRQASILVYWGRRGRFVFRARPSGPRIRIWVV
jgi:hypothetical protein